jgi:hypothetical protein
MVIHPSSMETNMNDIAKNIISDVKIMCSSLFSDLKNGKIPSCGTVKDFQYNWDNMADALEFLVSTANDTQLTVVQNLINRKMQPSRANRCKSCNTSHPYSETDSFWLMNDEIKKYLNATPPSRDISPQTIYRLRCRGCNKQTEWYTTLDDAVEAWNTWKLRRQDHGPIEA